MHQPLRAGVPAGGPPAVHPPPAPSSPGGSPSVHRAPPSLNGREYHVSLGTGRWKVALPDMCCCCSLTAGVVLTGLFTFVTSAAFVILLATRNLGQTTGDISEGRAVLTYMSLIIFGLLIPCSLLVIVGNIKEKYWIYVPWLIVNIIAVLLPVMLIIWIFTEKSTNALDVGIAVFHTINATVSIWGEICVLSHYKKMYRRKRHHRFLRTAHNAMVRRGQFYAIDPNQGGYPPAPYEPNNNYLPPYSDTDISEDQSGFNPNNLNLDNIRRRPPLPKYLLQRGREIAAKAFRSSRSQSVSTAQGGESQSEAQDHPTQQGQGPGVGVKKSKKKTRQNSPSSRPVPDPYRNFRFGEYSGGAQANYGATAETSGITVHREPLRSLGMPIPLPLDEERESELSENASSYTNSTQEMVSTLTSLGSRELARLSLWSQQESSKDKKNKNSKRPSREAERLQGQGNSQTTAENVNPRGNPNTNQQQVNQQNVSQQHANHGQENGNPHRGQDESHRNADQYEEQAVNPRAKRSGKNQSQNRQPVDLSRTHNGPVSVGVTNLSMDMSNEEPLVQSAPSLHRQNPRPPGSVTVMVQQSQSAGHIGRPLPPVPANVTTTSRVSQGVPDRSPQRAISPPLLHREASHNRDYLAGGIADGGLPPLYVGRAIRYADYTEQVRGDEGAGGGRGYQSDEQNLTGGYQWMDNTHTHTHDFGLTDQNFRPPKPYSAQAHTSKAPTHGTGHRGQSRNHQGTPTPVQVYQYGGYRNMDVYF